MKKQFKILCIVIILYFVVSIIMTIIHNRDKVVFIGNYTRVYVKGDELTVEQSNDTIPTTEVKYYFDEQFLDGYIFSDTLEFNNINHAEVLSKDKKRVQFEDTLLAETPNTNIKIKNVMEEKASEEEYKIFKNYFENNGKDYELSFLSKSKYGKESNGNLIEVFYANLNIDETHHSSNLLIKSGDYIEMIDSATISDDEVKARNISLYKYIDFNEDNNYEIVIKENNGDDQPVYYNIYSYENGAITKIE